MKDPTGPYGVRSDFESSRNAWEQTLREHPESEAAHEQASTVLQQQFPRLTLRQLRLAYPQVQFRWPSERVQREALEERRWGREVLRRGLFESAHLGANLAIAILSVLWLIRLLSRTPAARTGLFLAGAVVASMAAYHYARWRASGLMSRQVAKFTAWLLASLGMALVWGGICLAFAYGALRWFSVPAIFAWGIGGIAGFCGFVYIVAGEWSGQGDCLALPTSEGRVTLQQAGELHQGD